MHKYRQTKFFYCIAHCLWVLIGELASWHLSVSLNFEVASRMLTCFCTSLCEWTEKGGRDEGVCTVKYVVCMNECYFRTVMMYYSVTAIKMTLKGCEIG
jgi:hypothetical protein